MFDQAPPLRLEAQPTLGAPLVFQAEGGTVVPPVETVVAETIVPPAPVGPVAVPSSVDAFLVVQLATRLDVLIAETRGLRQDLADRTLAARVRRGWAWLQWLIFKD